MKQVDDPSNHGGAKRRRWRCSGDCGGQNGERWPRWRKHDGEVAGYEEERRSWNKLCRNVGGTTATANARQSSGDGDWKTEEESGEKRRW